MDCWEHETAGQGPVPAVAFCRHCGAALADGEIEDECSSAFNVATARLRWQAALILRELV